MSPRLLLCLLLLAAAAHAARPAATPAPTTPAPAPARLVFFHGKVAALDATAKSFTIKTKVRDVTFLTGKETIILSEEGAQIPYTALLPGAEVRGQAAKSGENWMVKKMTVSAEKPSATPKPKASPTPGPATKTAADSAGPFRIPWNRPEAWEESDPHLRLEPPETRELPAISPSEIPHGYLYIGPAARPATDSAQPKKTP